MLSVLEEQKDALTLSDLKILILNAETLMPSMVKRWLTLYPNIPIVNTYGATETHPTILRITLCIAYPIHQPYR